MSESPGKHHEMQEIRAERDHKAVEKLLPTVQKKAKQGWTSWKRNYLKIFFLSKMAKKKKKKVAICQQKVPPGSRVWADNLNGKGGLPGLVTLP